MIQNKILILLLFFVSFTTIVDAKFSSSVIKTDIAINEQFDLTLKLDNQEYLFEPKISFLNKDFYILSTEKSSQTTIINGQFNSNFIWIITLQPRKRGKVNIGSISIPTKNGEFSTKPIQLNIINKKKEITGNKIQIFTKISNKSPFENETINLSLLIYSKYNLYDVAIPNFNIDGFVVKNSKNTQSGRKNINGIETNFLQIDYLLTPIKSGNFQLRPIEVTGKFIEDNPARLSFNSFFNRVRDRNFIIKTKSIFFNVKKPLKNFDPWLPAHELSIIEEKSQNQEFEVGKPISRKFTISTRGISVTQVPQLLKNSDFGKNFKIYSNKPKITEEIINNQITGSRIEEYTIIPQKSGQIKFPQIKIKWWDVGSKKIKFATIAQKIIKIKDNSIKKSQITDKQQVVYSQKSNSNITNSPYLYLTTLLSLIFNIILTIILLRKRQKTVVSYPWIKGRISEITKLNNARELEIFIQRYVKKTFGKSLSTSNALEFLSGRFFYDCDKKKKNQIFKDLNQKIEKDKYGKEKINIELEFPLLKNELLKLKFNEKNRSKKKINNVGVDININP